ncbi:uncharacterized protein LOC126267856 [Schistocerca gregaria]|uniref:uncharacterized protein LOC126267856 n=1 Tax=Schistocerca gregaria TaxID=7010 RepID=UPI00211EBCC7|nr:uncharacterized protein LOC126267856 [Schistocerca gregaria]
MNTDQNITQLNNMLRNVDWNSVLRTLHSYGKFSKKQKHSESVIQNSNNISKTSWSLVNREIGKSGKHTTEKHLLINGTIVTDQNKIVDLFNNYFASVGSSINNQFKNHKYKFRRRPVSGSIFLMSTSKEEIIKIVSSLKNSHAAGYDGLSLDTLKKCLHKIASPLSTVINSHMEDGLTAKVIYIRIWNFLVCKKVISKGQYWFVKGSSTITAASNLIGGVTQAIDNKEHVCGIFLDIQKAFDCVDMTILLDKLWKYGIRGTAHNLMKSYLTNRKQFVSISTAEGAYKSNTTDINFVKIEVFQHHKDDRSSSGFSTAITSPFTVKFQKSVGLDAFVPFMS